MTDNTFPKTFKYRRYYAQETIKRKIRVEYGQTNTQTARINRAETARCARMLEQSECEIIRRNKPFNINELGEPNNNRDGVKTS